MAELISRTLAGEATPSELEELRRLGEKHPEDQYLLEILSEYWKTPGPLPDEEDLHSDAHFRHIIEAAEDALIIPIHRRPLRMAAVAILTGLLIGAGAWWTFYRPAPRTLLPVSKQEVAVKPGTRSRLLLPDGTSVWLNSDSKLTYDNHFGGDTREVTLEGEAFFDVAKSPGHPFIVHTTGIDIRVLGTTFNVKSYPREATFEATLIRGKIEVVKSDARIVLVPYEKLVLDKTADARAARPASGPEAAITRVPPSLPDSAIAETGWVYDKLVFDGETFTEMAAKMERWFNVKIVIQDPGVAALRFHVTFEHETIGQVLSALQVISSFDCTMCNNEIRITKKK